MRCILLKKKRNLVFVFCTVELEMEFGKWKGLGMFFEQGNRSMVSVTVICCDSLPQCNIHLKHKVRFVHLFLLLCVCGRDKERVGEGEGEVGRYLAVQCLDECITHSQVSYIVLLKWQMSPETIYISRCARLISRRVRLPVVHIRGLNHFMRRWMLWQLQQTDRGVFLFLAPLRCYSFTLLGLPDSF